MSKKGYQPNIPSHHAETVRILSEILNALSYHGTTRYNNFISIKLIREGIDLVDEFNELIKGRLA